jgi:hypothetical protein
VEQLLGRDETSTVTIAIITMMAVIHIVLSRNTVLCAGGEQALLPYKDKGFQGSIPVCSSGKTGSR